MEIEKRAKGRKIKLTLQRSRESCRKIVCRFGGDGKVSQLLKPHRLLYVPPVLTLSKWTFLPQIIFMDFLGVSKKGTMNFNLSTNSQLISIMQMQRVFLEVVTEFVNVT
jgi:hypothetical protein